MPFVTSSFLLLVGPGASSSVLAPSSMHELRDVKTDHRHLWSAMG